MPLTVGTADEPRRHRVAEQLAGGRGVAGLGQAQDQAVGLEHHSGVSLHECR